MKSTNSRITYAQLVSDVVKYCNAIGSSDCISEIARCVRSQMYLCGVGETALSHPTMKTICEAIAAASLYKEIEAAGVARRAQSYKAQNAAMRWAEKVAAELIADNADYAAVKARVFEQAGVEDDGVGLEAVDILSEYDFCKSKEKKER